MALPLVGAVVKGAKLLSKQRMVHTRTPDSSAIEQIGYNQLTHEMSILFRKDATYPEYVFGGVTEKLAAEFLLAKSKGGFYADHFKGNRSFKVSKALGSFRLGAVGRRIRNVVRRR